MDELKHKLMSSNYHPTVDEFKHELPNSDDQNHPTVDEFKHTSISSKI